MSRRQAGRIRELENQLAERDRRIAELEVQIGERDQRIAELEARLAELEEKLGTTSRNSGRPPSSDPSSTPRHPMHRPTGRRQGGQPGHPQHERALLPEDQVDHIEHLRVERCEKCGSKDLKEVGEPRRHQVTEIPEIRPRTEEFRQYTSECAICGHVTTAPLPPGVPRRPFGPRLEGITVMLSGAYQLGRRRVQALLRDLFGARISLGAIDNTLQIVSSEMKGPCDEALEHVQTQPVAFGDETGWREGRRKPARWLWVAVTRLVTVFLIQGTRGFEGARTLLGGFTGILTSDRAKAYGMWSVLRRQVCWAHLARNFLKISERTGPSGDIGRALLDQVEQLFRVWYRVRDGTLTFSGFGSKIAPIRREVDRLLRTGQSCGHAKTERTCREILTVFPALWTFARVPGLEPTNNAAERALRKAVIWRRISLGTQGPAGSEFVARMLTVTETLRQQDRNLLDYLTAVCRGRIEGCPAPSLLPA